jgi:hypothetical protein
MQIEEFNLRNLNDINQKITYKENIFGILDVSGIIKNFMLCV